MEIRNYRELPISGQSGERVASFDIYIEATDTIYRKWFLRRSKKGNVFPCSSAYSEGDGEEKKWFSYVEVGERRKQDWNKALKLALDPFVRPEWKRSSQEPQSSFSF